MNEFEESFELKHPIDCHGVTITCWVYRYVNTGHSWDTFNWNKNRQGWDTLASAMRSLSVARNYVFEHVRSFNKRATWDPREAKV
jgi:hypothetical protein